MEELDPEVAALARMLGEMSDLLRQFNNTHWASELDRCRSFLEKSDRYGAERFRGYFGGMGSLNYIVLQQNGYFPRAENARFDKLREESYTLVERLIH